ncbi:MAG TPA: NHL repeat-containing protein [Candidatus Cybelea sp.]|jgi:DNA-binding beta-propeller fold protein YncE|nr:NHL repeat-containing protein [Candidatus Cybelea sp.]
MRRCASVWRGSLLAFLVACSASNNGSIPPAYPLASTGLSGNAVPDATSHGTLFVANYYLSTIAVVPPGFKAPSRMISNGVSYPDSLAEDKFGTLYAGNYGAPSGSFTSTVTAYAHGGGSLSRTITNGIFGPYTMAVDSSGRLYVANNGHDTVTAYARGGKTPVRTILRDIRSPQGLAFDGKGNLYVANLAGNSVTVYPPTKNEPLRIVKVGMAGPSSIAIDAANNLYVANERGGSITIYTPGKWNAPRRLKAGIHRPIAIRTDGVTLYVLNYSRNVLAAYDVQTLKRIAATSTGIACPSTMTMSQNGLIYVASTCPSSVTVYSASDLRLQRTITKGISDPVALVVAP